MHNRARNIVFLFTVVTFSLVTIPTVSAVGNSKGDADSTKASKQRIPQPVESGDRPANFTGVWIVRHKNGRKSFESPFVKGQAHGLHTLWDERGNRIRQGEYVHGKSDGVWLFWKPSGELWLIRIEETGQTVREIHIAGLRVVADGMYKDLYPWHGTFRDWHYKNGHKAVYHEIRHGRPWNGQFWIPLDGPRQFQRRTRRTLATYRNGKQVQE